MKETPISQEKIAALDSMLKKWRILNIFWDLDNTFIETRAKFISGLIDSSGLLLFGKKWLNSRSAEMIEKATKLKEEFMDPTIRSLRNEFFVHPAVMNTTVHIAALHLGVPVESENYGLATQRVEDVYEKDIPEIYPESIQTVDAFNSTFADSYVGSHGQYLYTFRKVIGTGLSGKFKKIVSFDVTKPKSLQWKEKYGSLGIHPVQTLTIGDNYEADIVPNLMLGARAIWINQKRQPFMVEDQSKRLTARQLSRLIEVNSIGEVVDAVLSSP
jgi:FMN phosphatase YigB (HAD superfamily)